MPEASLFERAYKNVPNNSNIYIVSAATNTNLDSDLKDVQDINFIDYNMATQDELGHYYQYFNFEDEYYSNFLFIGKNNKIIGKLDYNATQEEMQELFNLTLASFEGIHKKQSIPNIILHDNVTSFDLNDYLYIEDGKDVELEIISNSNTLAITGIVRNRTLELYKEDYTGSSLIIVQVKVPEKNIAFNMNFYAFNSIGISDNFEYPDITESLIPWENDTNKWFITDETSFVGTHSIRSGFITDSMETSLTLTLNVTSQDFISFAYKTSSESDHDILSFYVDSTLVNDQDTSSLWSGSNDWRVVTYNLRPGIRTFTWTYSKNYLGSISDDCVWLDAIVLPASAVETTVENMKLPTSLALSNYPNPFNPTTKIEFHLSNSQDIKLNVFDIQGRLVETLFKGYIEQGYQSFTFDAKHLSNGIYYAVLQTVNQQNITKMILLK